MLKSGWIDCGNPADKSVQEPVHGPCTSAAEACEKPGYASVDKPVNSGVRGNQKQAVDQRRLRSPGLFQEFREFQVVEAVMPAGLPFLRHAQTPGVEVEDPRPITLIARARPARDPS